MEYIRKKNEAILGKNKFGIGSWVGNEVTPGKRTDSKTLLKNIVLNAFNNRNNLFFKQLPWCKA